MLDAVKKYRKGQKDKLDFLENLPGEKKNSQNKKSADNLRYDPKALLIYGYCKLSKCRSSCIRVFCKGLVFLSTHK